MKNGVINIYKEAGMTSFQVVYKIRKITGEQKIGHTGTLDPDAKGVLPICIGKATKLVDMLMDTDKQYNAVLLFGKRTTTQDISGDVLEETSFSDLKSILSPDKIEETIKSFVGTIEQVPPMFSAVKVNGVKLVDAARKGKTIDRKAREVKIYGFEDIDISGFDDDSGKIKVSFTVNCSKGTYIRTLCEDIGKKLNVPACMESLERSRTSGLSIESAISLEAAQRLAEQGLLEEHIIPIDNFLQKYKAIVVGKEAVKKLIFGNWLEPSEFAGICPAEEGELFRVYDEDKNFYAVYRYSKNDNFYKCEKMFI